MYKVELSEDQIALLLCNNMENLTRPVIVEDAPFSLLIPVPGKISAIAHNAWLTYQLN